MNYALHYIFWMQPGDKYSYRKMGDMRYMRIFELLTESARNRFFNNVLPTYDIVNRPRLTLRHLHKLRLQSDKEKKERKEHLAFLPTMYAAPEDDDSKKKKTGKSDNKVEKLAQKTAEQAIKAEDTQETKVGADALNSIKEQNTQ